MGKSSISFCVLLIVSVLWEPTHGNDKCSLACSGSSGSPAFLNGHKYQYGVEGVVTLFLSGADNQETSVKLLGQASVTVLGNCEHELSVQNLIISGPDGKKYPSPPGIDKPVRFTLQDGRVGAEICTVEGDTRRSLNIKRAIISLLQTEQKPSTQVDVFGTCPTDVSSSQEGGAVLVHRTRDLSRCGHREQGKNDLVTGILNPAAEIKDTKVLQSTLHVESKVNNGVPEKVSATEEYLYKPFSVGENGARAKVHTKLTLTGKASAAPTPSQCTEPRTIIFETPHGVTVSPNNQQAVLSAVKETAKSCTKEAGPKSAGNFAQLIRILRTSSKEDLLKIFNQVKGNSVEKRVFLDSLVRAGTGYSIEASINLLKSKQLDKLEEAVVYLSLGYARHVNNDALKAAVTLLDQPNLRKEIYLGVGALAGTYCREHNCHSGGNNGITAISQKLAAKLQNCKPKNKEEEDNVVAVLKGIRNIRHLEDNLVDKLTRCINDNTVKSRVKVAALEAIHADPCATKVHAAAMDILKNVQLDSEIRIKAYLAVIECPCAHSATVIKNVLEHEPIYQVGNFITSSLRAIRSSANPDKALARLHYGNIHTPNKFRIDERKYSFYKELSYNVDALGFGGSLDQTVIYSQDSFLPRSVQFNLTTELFGHSLNVFEVGGRQGNLDRVIEHFVGPKGLFMGKPQKVFEDLLKRYEESKKRVEEKFSRGRRSVKSEIDNFDKNLKAEATSYNNELDLDVYMKLFGTDALFLSFGNDKGFNFDNALDEIFKFVNTGINEVKHFQKEVNANLLFLDAELTYPTSTGLPLKLDLTGAITARFEASTNLDIRQIIQSPQNAKIDIKLVPSTDVEIAGLFLVDADSVTTGLKVINSLHSSTGGHVIAKVLENGNGFDLQLGLPVEKQEILTASNDLVFVTFEKGQKEKQVAVKVDTDRKEYSGCFDQLSGVFGLTICGEVSVPFSISGNEAQASIAKFLARYPLTGPSKVRLVVEKNDLRGYHIKGIYRHDNSRRNVELLFDAEGSQNRRTQLTGEVVYNEGHEYSVKLGLDSPIKKISGEVSIYNKPSELLAVVKAKNDDMEYFGKIGFNIQGNNARAVYRPIFEYQFPSEEKRSIPVEGQVIAEHHGDQIKYTLEGIRVRVPNVEQPLEIEGHVKTVRGEYDFDLKVKEKATVKGSINKGKLMLEFQNTLNPYINFRVDFKNEYTGELSQNDLELIYGGDLRNSKNKVILSRMVKFHKASIDNFNLITKNKFEIYALPMKIKFNADIDPKKASVEIGGQYIDRTAEFDLEARTKIKKDGDYMIKITAGVDKNSLEVFSKRDIESADKSNFENYLVIKNIGRYELSGVVLHKTKPGDMNVGAIGHFKVSGGGKNEDIKFDIGMIETASLYSSHGKVTNNQGELLDYLLKINKGDSPNGQLKLNLKDTIAANGQFKVTGNDGKGNGMIIVDFKKTQRKIKADVKFVVKDPVYSGDFDVYLNYEKDNNDKICFSTNTKHTDKVFDSKNKLEYSGKTSEVNVHHDGTHTATGKNHANVEIVLPTERCLTIKVDRDVSEKDEVYNGHAELVLTDAEKRGGAASTLKYKGKISNTNYNKMSLNYEGQLELSLKNGKKLQNNFFIKNNPEGNDKYKYDFKSDVTGNLLNKPISLSASGLHLDSMVSINEDYRFKGSFGEDISFELVGTWIAKLLEKGEKKYLDDFTVNVRLPFEKSHDIKWVNTILYLQPENKDVAEYTIVESFQINGDIYKVDANGKVGLEAGNGVVKLVVPHVDPMVLDVNYKNKEEGEKRAVSTEVKAKYGKGKSATMAVDTTVAPNDVTFQIKANAPHSEKLKKLELTVHSKNPAPDTYSSAIIIDIDSKVYKSEYTTVLSKVNPQIDFKYYNPTNSKTSRVYVKGDSLSSTQGKLDVKVENIREINLDLSGEANVQKDNVAFKLLANSEKLGFKNYEVEIASKEAGSGKRLEFHAVNDGKNVLSGSTSFLSKQEGQKTIIEGSGSVKVKEEQKSANFKFIRTLLTEGSEKGVETFFNIAIGERSYVAEARVTNMEYKNSYVYCEEKKQCAHVEIQSKIDVSKPGIISNLVNAGVDLRKLGIAPEFGLQIKDEVSDKRPPQYTLDLHVSKEELKYHLHVYNTPEFGNSKTGWTVTLPKRVIAVESAVTYPTNKQLPFPIKGEFSFDADKKKQGHKTSARFLVDLNIDDEKRQIAMAEFGFNHPRINKEAVAKIGGEIVRPQPNTIKIETHASVSHPTLGNDRQSKILFEANPNHFKLLVDTPLVKVIDVEGSATIKENLQQGDFKFCLLQGKPVQVRAIIKDYQYYELTTGYSDEADRRLSIIGHLEPEKRVDISADIILGGDKKNIIHGALFLQDNLVKSDYGISKENFNYFLNALKNDLTTLESRIKQLGDKASKDFKAITQKVESTMRKLREAYTEDLEGVFQTFANDDVFKQLSSALSKTVEFLDKMVKEVLEGLKPFVDKVTDTYVEISKKVQEMYEKQIQPQIKHLYETFATILKEYLDGLIDVVAHFSALFTDFFEKHKAELTELTNTFAEIFKDVTRLLVAQLKEFKSKLSDVCQELLQDIKDLPIFNVIKEKWDELSVPDQVLDLLKQAHDTVRDLMPTQEIREFLDALNNYVQHKLRQDKVDDRKELRVVYQKLATAVMSLVQYVRAQIGHFATPSTIGFGNFLLPTGFGQSLPTFGGSASLSLLKQVLRRDLPDPLSLVRAYRPRSLNPLEEVPKKLRAVVVNGQHIFTFDGRHLTFPGTCRYILAHDHVDRNFTLAIQLQNGAPKALLLEDKSGTTIEIKENGQVTLNNANHGFPVLEKDVFAFRQANGRIGLGSTYGLMAYCTSKLQVCYVEVSGFYLGKLRGLLGDGNNEPYDDFRLPNGKIVTSESEFGNAYRLARSCPAATAPAHEAHQLTAAMPAACDQVFGGVSPLRPLALLLDMAPFRQACVHACSANTPESLHQACDLARGYTALAVTGLLPAVLPDVCLQCTDADKPRNIGDDYELKVPNKQADIIVAVEITKSNEKNYKELVVPLVSQLVDQLKSKRISDIKVYLVGITSEMPYPILYDTDLKLKNAKVQFTDESRYPKPPFFGDNALTSIFDIVDTVKKGLGLTNVVAGYNSILDLPLRAGAIKHTISVVGEQCEALYEPVSVFRSIAYGALFDDMAYTHSLVTSNLIGAIGGGIDAANTVGVTKDNVILMGAKRATKESEKLRTTFNYANEDACIDFVEGTDGIVFGASAYLEMNPSQQKQYLQTATTAILNEMLHQTVVQDCTCVYAGPFRARSLCLSKDRKEAARRRK